MTTTCLNVIRRLDKDVEQANLDLINNMTRPYPPVKYELACVDPSVTYGFYYTRLKAYWEQTINSFLEQPDSCNSVLDYAQTIHKYATPENLRLAQQARSAASGEGGISGAIKGLASVDVENVVLNALATSITSTSPPINFSMSPDIVESMQELARLLVKRCKCQTADIFKTIVSQYKPKFQQKYDGMSKDQVVEALRSDYQGFKTKLEQFAATDLGEFKEGRTPIDPLAWRAQFMDKIATQFTDVHNLSVENELNKLIPNELGSLKEFFVTIISRYYNQLHPIIWAQIFKGATENLFTALPLTPDEFFAFGSRQLLLNSGPFILKILQMIRPVLSPELAKKYNLAKLTYPLMTPTEVELILSRAINNWELYRVIQSFSASVGHVVKVERADMLSQYLMIKIIKPLAIAQSCWEYHTLYNIFPEGTCEQDFVKNMLESNGRELDVNNEARNLQLGYKYYTANYREVFGSDIDAHLTTVQHVEGVVKPYAWFVLAMTLAPGIPLSKLVEVENNPLLETDNDYRARLHRCLDLLVYKFFETIVRYGFYHGDLHAGNIFFSYEKSQLTLIDFGAVGEIDVYSDDPSIRTLLDVMVMSSFFNYQEVLDKLTELLNSKCTETQIDTSTQAYADLRAKLGSYRRVNTLNREAEGAKAAQYKKDIFSKERIDAENRSYQPSHQETQTHDQLYTSSLYSPLTYQPYSPDTIVENRDVLPPFTKVGESNSVDFTKILEEIITFYAMSGVNIAIKFNDFYEIQKAYALLLGVLFKTNYSPFRVGIAIEKAIKSWRNLDKIHHVGFVKQAIQSWLSERGKFKEYIKDLPTAAETVAETAQTMHGGRSQSQLNSAYYQAKARKYQAKIRAIRGEIGCDPSQGGYDICGCDPNDIDNIC